MSLSHRLSDYGKLVAMAAIPEDTLLLDIFGLQLLAYLCNVTGAELEERLRSGSTLPQPSEQALRSLAPFAQSIAQRRLQTPGGIRPHDLSFLGQVPPGAETSIGNHIREAASGTILRPFLDTEAESDTIKSILFRLARDVYPQLLAPQDRLHALHTNLFQHPAWTELEAVLNSDTTLSQLYPQENAHLGRSSYIRDTLGRGSSVQMTLFADTVVKAAWDVTTMTTEYGSFHDLLVNINLIVDVIRDAIDGKEAQLPARIFFTGITTAGSTIETPWGPLRPITDAQRRAAPDILDGAIGGMGENGNEVTVSYGGEIVLETSVPFVLEIAPLPEGDDDLGDQPDAKAAQELWRQTDGVMLAAFLGVDRSLGSWATARFTWQWIADPLTPGSSTALGNPKASPSFMPYELSEHDCQEMSVWSNHIDQWPPAVDIAVARVLSAAQTRSDPTDRLVDSVIAWENLFGSSQGEPRLRISAAMARLLANTREDRERLQSEVKELYDLRSKIVHGGTFKKRTLSADANRALDLARASLRAMFQNRREVLNLADGAQRSLRLILGP